MVEAKNPWGFAAAGGINVWLDMIGNRVLQHCRRVTGSLRCRKASTWRSNLAAEGTFCDILTKTPSDTSTSWGVWGTRWAAIWQVRSSRLDF